MAKRWPVLAGVLAWACLLTCLAGCATPDTHQRSIRLTLAASADLNPDRDGRPSPVIVRIYELAEADDFRHAAFFDLYDRDKSILNKAVLARTVIAVRPGQRLSVCKAIEPHGRYLAVFAAYRDIDGARWRAVANLPEDRDSFWTATLGNHGVKMKENTKKGSDVLE
jgi:type VI secretion system protein VasD